MVSKRHERTAARQAAVQLLYTADIQEEDAEKLLAEGRCLSDIDPLPDYALQLFMGVSDHQAELDEYLANTSENWALERMPMVDRAILRLAAYEMLYEDDVPISVSINEAVELAKAFGGEDESHRFVNGILGRIAKQIEEDAKSAESADE